MYTTIDSNPCITYSEVKNVLVKVKGFREKLLAKGLKEITLPLKSYVNDVYALPYLAGVTVEIIVPLQDDDFGEYVVFQWITPQGYEHVFWVNLATRENNLGLESNVGYFICPVTQHLCRKLYTDGISLCSRYGIQCVIYNSQSESHKERILTRMHRARKRIEEAECHNQSYKGKPTKWAKKIEVEEKKLQSYKQIVLSNMLDF